MKSYYIQQWFHFRDGLANRYIKDKNLNTSSFIQNALLFESEQKAKDFIIEKLKDGKDLTKDSQICQLN